MFRSLAVAAMLGGAAGYLHERSFYEAKFVDWLKEHNVQLKNGDEFAHRLSVFADNFDFIEEENAKNLPYTLALNEYSMYTHEEFVSMMGLDKPIPEPFVGDYTHDNENTVDAPTSIDWVSLGAVTGVKDQGNCGSCWSFSATGCLEGIYKIKRGSLQSFSEQQLVSCDTLDSGCNGGWMTNAFKWIQGNNGLCSESGYPYTSGSTGQRGSCSKSCSNVSNSRIASWADVAKSESALQTAVAQQPTSVAIDAGSRTFQSYQSGVYTGSCGTSLNHGVLAVGYGNSGGLDFWKVKNSWGTSWGEGGYIRMQRNIGTYGGKCGITLGASYASL